MRLRELEDALAKMRGLGAEDTCPIVFSGCCSMDEVEEVRFYHGQEVQSVIHVGVALAVLDLTRPYVELG